MRAFSQEVLMNVILNMCLEITLLQLVPHLAGANVLTVPLYQIPMQPFTCEIALKRHRYACAFHIIPYQWNGTPWKPRTYITSMIIMWLLITWPHRQSGHQQSSWLTNLIFNFLCKYLCQMTYCYSSPWKWLSYWQLSVPTVMIRLLSWQTFISLHWLM